MNTTNVVYAILAVGFALTWAFSYAIVMAKVLVLASHHPDTTFTLGGPTKVYLWMLALSAVISFNAAVLL